MAVKQFNIKVQYHIVEHVDYKFYASDEEQAKEIALLHWREGHKEICKDPKVISIKEII